MPCLQDLVQKKKMRGGCQYYGVRDKKFTGEYYFIAKTEGACDTFMSKRSKKVGGNECFLISIWDHSPQHKEKDYSVIYQYSTQYHRDRKLSDLVQSL